MKQPTCDHVGFFTRNAKELAVFYTKILDFELIHDSMLSKSIVQTIFGLADDCRFVKLRKNDFIVEIFEPVSTELQKRVS
jgi:catechol 2,3-dioxygenase-like lactoylglutathione lyase family enzyme